MELYAKFTAAATKFLGIGQLTFERILLTVTFIALFYIMKHAISSSLEKRVEDVSRRYSARKSFTYIAGFITVIILIFIWIGEKKSAATYLGLISAGFAIALRDPIVNFAGWLYIVVRNPFRTGDRIEINKIAGDVVDVQLFRFTLMEIGNWVDADQSTGRIIHIPNGDVFNHAIANFNQGFKFIWNEIPVMVTFESDWQKAKKILTDIVNDKCSFKEETAQRQIRSAAKKYMIFFKHLTPIVWTKVSDSGVVLTMRYLCSPKNRRGSEELIWEAILTEFSRHKDIDLAYPTRRAYNNRYEGKPGKKKKQVKRRKK